MRFNLNPTSERGASRDAVNRPRETLGDSHLISSDLARFGLVCDLLCCRGNISVDSVVDLCILDHYPGRRVLVITMLGCHQSTDHYSARNLLVDGPPDGKP